MTEQDDWLYEFQNIFFF